MGAACGGPGALVSGAGAAGLRDGGDQHTDDGWVVRPVTGAASTKPYRCPGCDHLIRPGTPHRVVWPEGVIDERRHWHTPCWARRQAGFFRFRRTW